MTCNGLLMNNAKPEVLPVVPWSASHLAADLYERIGSEVYAAEHVRYLGVYLYQRVNMTAQSSRTFSTCTYATSAKTTGNCHSREQSMY